MVRKKFSVEGMRIKELTYVSEGQIADILSLMGELTSSTVVTPEMLAQNADSVYFELVGRLVDKAAAEFLAKYQEDKAATLEKEVANLTEQLKTKRAALRRAKKEVVL